MNRIPLLWLPLLLTVIMMAATQDPPSPPSPPPPTNILPHFNPHMRKCNDAMLDARGRPCLQSALSSSPALTQAYAEALRADTAAASSKLAHYASLVYTATQAQCTPACFAEYKQSASEVLAACATAAFKGDERFDLVGSQVVTAALLAHQWTWGHAAMCMRSPSSGYACAYDLARDNGTRVSAALDWAVVDKLADRAATHQRTLEWITSAPARRETCGGCMLGVHQVRMVGHRVSGDALDRWEREKGVGVLETNEGTRPRIQANEKHDEAFVATVTQVCKDTAPLVLNAKAKSLGGGDAVKGLRLDEASGQVTVDAVYLYDTPGLGAGAIVGIVFGVLAAVGAAVAGYFYWYKQRTGRVPVTFHEVREMVMERVGAKKLR